MKAKVNPETCASCGVCVDVCPDVFEMNDQNIAVVKINPIPPHLEDKVREAAQGCPPEAIIVEE